MRIAVAPVAAMIVAALSLAGCGGTSVEDKERADMARRVAAQAAEVAAQQRIDAENERGRSELERAGYELAQRMEGAS